MSQQEIDEYFGEIGNWMKNDLKREIELARVSQSAEGQRALLALGIPPGGGNLLAALGLVAYSEALGLLRVYNATHGYGTPPGCFLAFFDRMGGGRYKTWRLQWEATHAGMQIYDVLRSGLVHEYRPKVDSGFWIASGDEIGLADVDGALIFKVAPYYRHFCEQMDELQSELRALPNPQIPPPKIRVPKSGGSPPSGGWTGASVGSGPSRPGPIVSPTSTPG
jgi:hypothetical protein